MTRANFITGNFELFGLLSKPNSTPKIVHIYVPSKKIYREHLQNHLNSVGFSFTKTCPDGGQVSEFVKLFAQQSPHEKSLSYLIHLDKGAIVSNLRQYLYPAVRNIVLISYMDKQDSIYYTAHDHFKDHVEFLKNNELADMVLVYNSDTESLVCEKHNGIPSFYGYHFPVGKCFDPPKRVEKPKRSKKAT